MQQIQDRDAGLKAARGLAVTADYVDFRAVERKMLELGYLDASLWFADRNLAEAIDEICKVSRGLQRGR